MRAPPLVSFSDSELALVFAAGALLDSGSSRAAMLECFVTYLPEHHDDAAVTAALARALLVEADARAAFENELRTGLMINEHRAWANADPTPVRRQAMIAEMRRSAVVRSER